MESQSRPTDTTYPPGPEVRRQPSQMADKTQPIRGPHRQDAAAAQRITPGPSPAAAMTGFCAVQGQPWLYRVMKHTKSAMFNTGGVVLLSQLAYVLPWTNLVWKQMKSRMFSTGGDVLPSQLA